MIPILSSIHQPIPVPGSLERFQNRTDHALPKPDNSLALYKLKAGLCDVEADGGNLHGGRLLCSWLLRVSTLGTSMPSAGGVHPIIKLHKAQLASDHTSCRSPLANQVRLVLHAAAYWLMLAVRNGIPKIQDLARAEFKTIRLRLLKTAARIIETKSRIRVAFATACPDAELFRGLAISLQRCGS